MLDFDAHHGNGTESILWDDPGALTVSLHQYPFFPGTGGSDGPSALNFPLPAGASGRLFQAGYERALERIAEFDPELLLVEAGLDAHAEDWTSDLALEDEDFLRMGAGLAELASGRALVMELGGGYTEGALSGGLRALLSGMLALELEPRASGTRYVGAGRERSTGVAQLAAGLSGLLDAGLTLTDSFPYAALFGAFLERERPDWRGLFAASCPELSALELAQARQFELCAFLERALPERELLGELRRYLEEAPGYVRLELANTLSWYAEETIAAATP